MQLSETPPYLNVDTVWGAKDARLQHLKNRYPHVHTDKTDLLFYFMARSAEICKGEIGLIVSRSFLEADKAQKLRGWLSENVRVRRVIDMRHTLVFPRVGINTAIVFFTKSKAPKTAEFLRHKNPLLPVGYTKEYFNESSEFDTLKVDQSALTSSSWNFGSKTITPVLERIDAAGTPLGEIFLVGKGMETGANKAFTFQSEDHSLMQKLAEEGFIKQRARNSDIKVFSIEESRKWVIFPYRASTFHDLPEILKSHLLEYRAELEQRAAFVRGDCEWWKYSFPLHLDHFNSGKLVSPYMARTNSFAYDLESNHFFSTDTTVLYGDLDEERSHFLIGILNSDLLSARFRFLSKLKGGRQYEYFAKQISRLPVPLVEQSDAFHKFVVSRVGQILRLQIEAKSSLVNSEKREAENVIAELRGEIENGLRDLLGVSGREATALIDSAD